MSSDNSDYETYPYGRKGAPFCYYEKPIVSDGKLAKSGDYKDNDVNFRDLGRIAVLYEAPAEDDPGRGHFSVWTARDSTDDYTDDYEIVAHLCITGDDDMIFSKFEMFEEMELESLEEKLER